MQSFSKYSNGISKVFSLFEDKYKNIYRSIQTPNKSSLIEFSGITYKRWYYSAFINGTFFSPANIFSSQVKSRTETHLPVIQPKLNGKNVSFEFEIKKFSQSSHPITEDLKKVVEIFYPDSFTNDKGYLSDEKTYALMQEVTFYDPFYVMFLTELAFKLKLIKRLESIHSYKSQPVQNYEKFFDTAKKNQLDKIIEATIEICSERLSFILPIGAQIFNPVFVKSLLINPMTTDEIFEYVYKSLNIDILSMIDGRYNEENDDKTIANEQLDEFDDMLLSSTFFLGLAIDQWFLTPFGHYLQLIQPLYFFPYNMKNEMYYLLDDINANSELISSVFTPCTAYNITALGEKLFDTKVATDNSFPHVNLKGKLDDFLNDLFAEMEYIETSSLLDHYSQNNESSIYELKIKLQLDKRCWKIIEIEDTGTLHDLHNVIAFAFAYSPSENYSFFTSPEPSPFFEYDAPWSERKVKKASECKIREAFKNKKIQYTCMDIFAVEIELAKSKFPVYNVSYPRVTRKSKRMEEYEKQINFDFNE